MNTPILSSTFFLTLLLMVGLIFFIRGSVKERTQQVQFKVRDPENSLLSQLQIYFNKRSYQVSAVNPVEQQITFEGFVRPSWFLAIFLTILTAVGMLCLGLVLSFLYPSLAGIFLALTFLSPASGIFYWKNAGRIEQVKIQVDLTPNSEPKGQRLITIVAHRDELKQLQQAFPFKAI